MALLGKLFGKGEEPEPTPDWAAFFEAGGFHHIESLLRADLDRRQVEYTWDTQEGALHLTGANLNDFQLGLTNLAQICSQSPRRQWYALIRNHFDRILKLAASADSEAQEPDR